MARINPMPLPLPGSAGLQPAQAPAGLAPGSPGSDVGPDALPGGPGDASDFVARLAGPPTPRDAAREVERLERRVGELARQADEGVPPSPDELQELHNRIAGLEAAVPQRCGALRGSLQQLCAEGARACGPMAAAVQGASPEVVSWGEDPAQKLEDKMELLLAKAQKRAGGVSMNALEKVTDELWKLSPDAKRQLEPLYQELVEAATRHLG